jgi:hypothetical protein
MKANDLLVKPTKLGQRKADTRSHGRRPNGGGAST